jgi:hypothetical protein
MLAAVDVVGDDLHAQVRQRGCGVFLGQKHSTYLLGSFVVVQFKNNTFLHSINIAIYCSKVPPR